MDEIGISLENASISDLKSALSKIEAKATQAKIKEIDSGKFGVLRLDGKIHIYNHALNKDVTRGADKNGTL